MKKIKHIIFDLGGVLFNINYKKTEHAFNELGIKNASKFYSKQTQVEIFNQLECGKLSKEKFIIHLKKYVKNVSENEIIHAWNSMLLDLPDENLLLLEKLHKKYSLFLLSNTNSIHITEIKNQIGKEKWYRFCKNFKQVYLSYEVGMRKPDIEIFNYILKEHSIKESETLFIDDSLQHIEGAKKVGLNTYHIKSNERVISLFPDIAL